MLDEDTPFRLIAQTHLPSIWINRSLYNFCRTFRSVSLHFHFPSGLLTSAADTDKVKAATNELRNTYYPHPESLLWLLQILTSHESSKIRQQAAVEATRLIPKHWAVLAGTQKPAIRDSLLQSTISEQERLVRHSAARVISAIAKIDLEDGEWLDLPQLLLQAAGSKDVHHREVGIYILHTLLQAVGDSFTDKLPNLFALFNRTIQDPESSEVRLSTLLALCTVATLIDPDESPEALQAFREIFPYMVSILKSAVDEGDENVVVKVFDVFQTLLGCESALLASHFRDLVQFMLDLAVNIGHPEDSRSQALSFLMQCVKYRRMKIQGLRDMGVQLTTKSMQIVTEISDDDEDDLTPARSALWLLDLLAGSLPPRQVIVPLLKELPQYVNSGNPSHRKAGILALSMCVEGAPDFIGSQLPEIIPIIMKLLHDPDAKVRQATLHGVGRLADDLAEDMSKEHAMLIPALLKNLDSAMELANNEAEQKLKAGMMIGACTALDSLVDGMDTETMAMYAPELVPRLGRLFNHPDYKVKASAAGAMGSVAGAAGPGFLPYFEPTMEALSDYVNIKDSTEELDLRGTVCDAMGNMAAAVGRDAFKPYVLPLMRASEESLRLDHPRLRETSYILWSTLAKVYEEDFTQFLNGVIKGLLESLEQEETDMEVELGEEAAALIGKEVVVAGRKVKVATATDRAENADPMIDTDDDSEDDWNGLTSVTAVALEKEIAVEVIGDVLCHTRQNFLPFVDKTIETVISLVDHSYEGVRKSAISTLWRSYTCLWTLMEDHTGQKWQPGIPLKKQPSQELVKLGEVIAPATMGLWEDETDRCVIQFFGIFKMMNNITLYPAHSDAQVAHAVNTYIPSD
jgi:importin-4